MPEPLPILIKNRPGLLAEMSASDLQTNGNISTRKPRKGAAVIAASMHGFGVGSSKAP